MNFDALTDPHSTRLRIWFRRLLIAACAVMFALLQYQAWHAGNVTTSVAGPYDVPEVCSKITITNLAKHDLVHADCVKRFADGSYFHREGV